MFFKLKLKEFYETEYHGNYNNMYQYLTLNYFFKLVRSESYLSLVKIVSVWSEWFKLGQNGLSWVKMVSVWSEWFKLGQNGFEFGQNGLSWVRMV